MKGLFTKIAIAIIVLGLAVQFIPIKQDNSPVTGDIEAPAAVKAVLRKACYNCHSNETTWPWYTHIAPGSWLITWDVDRGRKLMNFSHWDKYDAEQKGFYNSQIYQMVSTKQMPPVQYMILHPEARLDSAMLMALKQWKGSASQ
jgi:hypothetical protein